MALDMKAVADLRARTGAGILKCKKALEDAGGDLDKAIRLLREAGLVSAVSKASRKAKEGVVASYIHAGGKIGVLVEINCETDFVALNPSFQAFVKDVALHVAAAEPRFVRREDVCAETVEQEKSIYKAQAEREGKPEKVQAKIIEGRLEKFFSQICLLEQPFVKDPDMTVGDLTKTCITTLGENIVIRRFARFKLGEDADDQS